MYSKYRDQMKTGDVIAFSGKGIVSTLIKLKTLSDISHVGIVYGETLIGHPRILLMESTTLNNLPDYKTGRFTKGVQMHLLSTRLNAYDGKVYWCPLKTPLSPHGEKGMVEWLTNTHGKCVGYDTLGALGAGFDLIDYIGLANQPDFSSLFCSELVCKALQFAGLIPDCINASEQTPADVVSYGCLDDRVEVS